MKVLLVGSEVAPITKLGGLGDVMGSLPKALEKLGVNIDVIVPYFNFAKTEGLKVYKSIELNVPYNNENNVVEVFNTKLPGSDVDVILLRNSQYFLDYGSKQTTIPEIEIFSFFDRCVVSFIESKFNTYDLIHCNDWHTGMINHILDDDLKNERPATLFTIHNLMYQGVSDTNILKKLGIAPGTHPLIDYDISDGDLNFMQEGIGSSDYINTVSPSYAREILDNQFPGELADILQNREARFCGILNGIDYTSYPRTFDIRSYKTEKSKLKKELQKKLSLNSAPKKPLFAFIGRLDPNQKGIDILHGVVETIINNGGQFVLLGSGDKEWESRFLELGNNTSLSENISVILKFDVSLAELIYSGADYLVVPSKYEPCGLIQMMAFWYGTLPIAHLTGGLKDTVKHRTNGLTFKEYTTEDLKNAVTEAFSIYNGQSMDEMIATAMSEDFSWEKSAKEYKKLYEKVIQLRIDSKF